MQSFDQLDDYIIGRKLGEGSSGKVVEGICISDGQKYALKILKLDLTHQESDEKSKKQAK